MPELRAHLQERVRIAGDGWRLPVPPGENPMGLPDADDGRWVGSKLTDHPAKSVDRALPRADFAETAVPRT